VVMKWFPPGAVRRVALRGRVGGALGRAQVLAREWESPAAVDGRVPAAWEAGRRRVRRERRRLDDLLRRLADRD
jgi:hypothetical protein